MKCFSEVMQPIRAKRNSGSITSETAIVLPFVLLFLFLFISFLQYISVYFVVSKAGSTTAEYMSYYACIYYEQGVEKIGNAMSTQIYKSLGDEGIVVSDALTNSTENLACSTIAHAILNHELQEYEDTYVGKLFKIDNISLLQSKFFEKGNDFKLHISCTSDLLFPIPFFNGKGYEISVNLSGKGWLRGNVYSREKEAFSVWALDNLNRGKKIEKHFGSNLPYDYPSIDIYDKKTGKITLIRSLDHTTDTYMKAENIKKTLKKDLDRIVAFNGTQNDSSVSSANKISAADIKSRKILLITPENEMTVMQLRAIADFWSECNAYQVEFEGKTYQISP